MRRAPWRAMPLKSLLWCVCTFCFLLFFHVCASFIFYAFFSFLFLDVFVFWCECDRLYIVNTRVSHKCKTIECIWLGVSNRAFEIFVEFSSMFCCFYTHTVCPFDCTSTSIYLVFFSFFVFVFWESFFRVMALYGLIFCVIGLGQFLCQRTRKKKTRPLQNCIFNHKCLRFLLLFGFKPTNSCDSHTYTHTSTWKLASNC